MNDYRSDKVALLFEEAVEISDPGERAAFLTSACEGAVELQKRVEALLQAHEAAGQFLRVENPRNGSESGDPARASDTKAGDRVGPYRLMGLIGEGSTSTVFVAEQEEPVRRWVALKIVKPGMDTQKVISRFDLERQALALMDHPGIAKVFDAGATPGGRPFFVMELVKGTGITAYCDEQRLTIPQRLGLFVQVCQAVLHAHQKGIMHRDIKPDNILVCRYDGHAVPKIIDFGIAKVLHTWSSDTTPRTVGLPFLGTPAYMSPEQAQMTSPDLDTRTDIYSLGALLCELLVGHPPFDHKYLMGAGLEEMCRIVRNEEPLGPSVRFARLSAEEQSGIAAARGTSPDELRRMLSGDLDWITLKALEKERDRRYATAAGLAEDINRHLEHLPVSAAAPTLQYRFSKLIRRHREAVITAAVVCLLLLGSAVVTTSLAIRARSSARHARTLQAAAFKAQQASHGAMVGMHVSAGLSAADEAHHDQAVLWFANAANAAGRDRPEYAVNLRRALSWLEQAPIPVAAFQLSAAISVLEFSPSSHDLLIVDREGRWMVLNCEEQKPLAWVGAVGAVTAAAWHPHGSLLALVQGQRIQIRGASDGKLLHQVPASEKPAALGFTPDGSRVLFGGRRVQALDLRTGALLASSWEHPQPAVGFAFAPESNLVASISSDGSARIFSTGEGQSLPGRLQTIPHRDSIRTGACASKTKYREDFLETPIISLPAFARGNVLLTRTGPYEISAWDLGTASVIQTYEGLCCSCRFVISPDGTLMACGLQGSKVGVWDIATARPRTLLASYGACMLDVAFGPSAENILTAEAGGTARLWSKAEGKEIYSAMHHTAEVDKVAFASNGRLVATAQVDGLVRLWVLPRINAGGHTLASDYGPKIVRMDSPRDHFVSTKEPAWDARIRTVTVYSAATGKSLGQTLQPPGFLQDAAVSPDCNRLALALSTGEDKPEGILQFAELETGRVLGQASLRSVPSSVAWHPDGLFVAVICRSGELLRAKPGEEELAVWADPIFGAPDRINPAVSFTPDGKTLVSLASTGRIEVRNSSTGELRYSALQSETGKFWSFAISGDSQRVATTTAQGEVRVWNLQNGTQAGTTLYHPGWVYRCRFSPDGTRLLTGSHDAKCRIWDLESGQVSSPPLIHPGEVYDAAFTPDGSSVLTVCRDGNVRLWEPQTGLLLAPPFRAGAQAFNVEITADGRHAVIGSLGTAIHVLSLAPFEEGIGWSSRDLCLLGEVVSGSSIARGEIRNLTTKEWLQRLGELRGSNTAALFRAVCHSRLPEPSVRENAPAGLPAPVTAAALQAPCPQRSTCGRQCPGSESDYLNPFAVSHSDTNSVPAPPSQ